MQLISVLAAKITVALLPLFNICFILFLSPREVKATPEQCNRGALFTRIATLVLQDLTTEAKETTG